MPLLPGELLNKRYRIVSLLAKGSRGVTYRAWDIKDRQDYAIKEYLDPALTTQRAFRAEARRLTRLSHPQLPTVRDHFSLEGMGQYLVSDYIEGVDLQTLLDQYGTLPADLVTVWLQSACQPLVYLHEQEQLHLNIKPANLRLTPSGDLFLVDTGLPELTLAHAKGYGSPEQQVHGNVTAVSDIYSLGATLYTLLTGQVPPPALGRESGLDELIPAREVNPDVEPHLSIVASRAMSLRPDTRYETVQDFAQALNRPLGKAAPQTGGALRRTTPVLPAPVAAAAAANGPHPLRWRGRIVQMRVIAGLAMLLLLLIGMGIAVAYVNTNERFQTADQVDATATMESAVIAALTAIADTPTPEPQPSPTPEPTPAPLIDEATGMRMLYVPAGSFRMGREDGENNEQPARFVALDSFYIDQTEVTNGQYRVCVEEGVCRPPASPNATYHSSYYNSAQYNNYPVIFVDWFMARDFCEWRGARLPTEAEWEKAAGYNPQTSTRQLYPWGNEFDGVRLNFCDANCTLAKRTAEYNDGHRDTAPVGSYPDGRSPLGMYDMAGNVMEWVNDWFDGRYYQNAPTDTNPMGPPEGTFKSIRGGSWLSDPDEVTVTRRFSYDPSVARANLGFRCAATPP
jgi:eukaryotic-like serine/threonine-protein kinase